MYKAPFFVFSTKKIDTSFDWFHNFRLHFRHGNAITSKEEEGEEEEPLTWVLFLSHSVDRTWLG